MRKAGVLLIFLIPFSFVQGQGTSLFPRLRGPYFGQKTPGITARMFAPSIISTGLNERDIAISSDGKEIYYGIFIGGRATIMMSRLVNGIWSEPSVPSFASDRDFNFFEPSLSHDGKRLLFLSTLPPAGEAPRPGWGHQNIWAVDRLGDDSWGRPRELGHPVNSAGMEYFPSLAVDGTLYFTRSSSGSAAAVFRSRWLNGGYTSPEKLPPAVNGSWNTFNACIAPDESYLIACVVGKDTTLPRNLARYYVSFHESGESWSALIDLGDTVNLPGSTALSPSISPDGKYLFFALNQSIPPAALNTLKDLGDMVEIHNDPLNGSANIYWISTEIINELRSRMDE